MLAAACSLTLVGLAALPGVSGAAKGAHPASKKAPPPYYLSLGDSYSVGYQPNTDGSGGVATAGYTAYVAKKEKMQLENFGCGGATTSSIITALGCTESGYGPPAATDAVDYDGLTQEQGALDFIENPANHGRVGLITISIGGNDVTSCASQPTLTAILGCVETADTAITTNVTSLVSTLAAALTANGDTTAKIAGLTYPDVILGGYVNPGGSSGQTLATASVAAFDDLINPTLRAAYTSVTNGLFVDVTQAPYKLASGGDDTPQSITKKLQPYGVIPASVWEICELTYYCTLTNIHANTKGYTFIGKLVVADL
jgi:lysophospholipase L1-like esterase